MKPDYRHEVYSYLLHTWEATGHILSSTAIIVAFQDKADAEDILDGWKDFFFTYWHDLRERNPKYLETYYARVQED